MFGKKDMANSKILTNKHTTKKNWVINQGAVGLDFTIDIEIKTNLKDFLAVLQKAQTEIEAEIAKHDQAQSA